MKLSPTIRARSRQVVAVAVAALSTGLAPSVLAAPGSTERVSVASDGTQSNAFSFTSSISADGRFVAFDSDASNLVVGDSNDTNDIFVHDRETGATARVNVASDGTQSNGFSFAPSISADGRYVTFDSLASNLVVGDGNGTRDVFVHERETGTTERVSVATGGTQANNHSSYPSISADGSHVAFNSNASNLVAGDSNGTEDVFVHDRGTDATERVSVVSGGTQANDFSFNSSISADGRHVAFNSNASNLVAGDSNGIIDVFVHDRQTDATERVSVATGGTQANGGSFRPSISADGSHVAFNSNASNLVVGDTNGARDVFVHDRQTDATERVNVATGGTQANGFSYVRTSISADGRHVAFDSDASNLVVGDNNGTTDVFVHDRQTEATERVSVASDGTQGNGGSSDPSISTDGRYVAFPSAASNLVANDTNGNTDVFVHDREGDATPPDTTITGGPEGPTVDSTPTFTFASSETGSTFECRIDTESFGVCSGPGDTHTTSALADGAHTFEVQATDAAGNPDATPAGRSFTVDTDPPQTTVRGPQETTKRRPRFRLESDEPGSTFSCKLDSNPYRACTSPYRTPRLALGQHVLRAKATDGVGNTDTTPAKKTFRVRRP